MVSVSVVLLLLAAVAGQLKLVNAPLVDIYAVLMGLFTASTVFSFAAYTIGQFVCLMAHPKNSMPRQSISKSLRISFIAITIRLIGAAAGQPMLKSVGSIFGASAFNHFLSYLSAVSTQFGQWDIHLKVDQLARMYQKFFGFLILMVLLFVAAPLPPRLSLILVTAAIGGSILFFVFFAARFCSILFQLSRVASSYKTNRQVTPEFSYSELR